MSLTKMLREIVRSCYEHFRQPHLLTQSDSDLPATEPAIKIINNKDGTVVFISGESRTVLEDGSCTKVFIVFFLFCYVVLRFIFWKLFCPFCCFAPLLLFISSPPSSHAISLFSCKFYVSPPLLSSSPPIASSRQVVYLHHPANQLCIHILVKFVSVTIRFGSNTDRDSMIANKL